MPDQNTTPLQPDVRATLLEMVEGSRDLIAASVLLYAVYEDEQDIDADDASDSDPMSSIFHGEGDSHVEYSKAVLEIPGIRNRIQDHIVEAIHGLLYDDHFGDIGESIAIGLSDEQKAKMVEVYRTLKNKETVPGVTEIPQVGPSETVNRMPHSPERTPIQKYHIHEGIARIGPFDHNDVRFQVYVYEDGSKTCAFCDREMRLTT